MQWGSGAHVDCMAHGRKEQRPRGREGRGYLECGWVTGGGCLGCRWNG